MNNLGFNVNVKQTEEMIYVADINGDGTIELKEFLKLMVGQLKDKHTKHEYARKF